MSVLRPRPQAACPDTECAPKARTVPLGFELHVYCTTAELPEVPDIMEFSSLVRINSARDVAFNMLDSFFVLRVGWFVHSRSPSMPSSGGGPAGILR